MPWRPEFDYRRDFPSQCEDIHGYNVDLAPSRAIHKSLEVFDSKQWGFVIFRCTYKSQEKWNQFITELKERAQEYVEERRRMKDVWDAMVWTIIEDLQTLEGATYSEVAPKFQEWREKERDSELIAKDISPTMSLCPRYNYFIHGNEESVESVVNDAIARKEQGYYFTLVSWRDIMLIEEELKEKEEAKDEEEEGEDEVKYTYATEEEAFYENRYVEKRFKADSLVGLYADLLELDNWYEMLVLDSLVTWTTWDT